MGDSISISLYFTEEEKANFDNACIAAIDDMKIMQDRGVLANMSQEQASRYMKVMIQANMKRLSE